MQGIFKLCARCNQKRELIARKLCWPCYMAVRRLGEWAKYPTECGEAETPTRPKFEWLGNEDELVEMTERAVKAELALRDLKAALMATIHLSEGVKKRIAAATSSAEISEIINAAQRGESPVAAATVGQKLTHRFYIGNRAFDAVGDSIEELEEQEARTRRHYAAQVK
jgi:hypothetical protein